MNRPVLLAVLAVLILGGGVVGFYLYREASRAEAQTAKLVAEALLETSAEKLDSSSTTMVLRRVKKAIAAADSDPPITLVRACCQLEFALDRVTDAWETISGLALMPGAEPTDQLLGSEIRMRLFEMQGSGGHEALGLAVAHFEASNSPASLFRAWQIAYRTGSIESWLEFQTELQTNFADTEEGEFAIVAAYHIGLLMVRRLGIADDEVAGRASASQADEVNRFCASILAAESTGKALRASGLIQQSRSWDIIPPEMNLLIATMLVSEGNPGEEQLHEALVRIKLALERNPANVDSRYAAAIIHYAVGDKKDARDHVDWLLTREAATTDARHKHWLQLRSATRLESGEGR